MTVETDTSSAKFSRVRPARAPGHRRLARRSAWASPDSSWWSPTRTSCSTRPGTSPARSRSTGTPTSTTRVVRDYVDGAGFAALLGGKGISRDDTVVIYGDKNNWWAAYALWVFSLFGHEDVRLLDGGRAKWERGGPRLHDGCPQRRCRRLPGRGARRRHAARLQGRRARPPRQGPLIDVRSPEEYNGDRTTAPAYPEEGALRAGHIPTAQSAVGEGRRRGRHVQAARASSTRSTAASAGLQDGDADRGVLPHRRALEPHLVRAHPPARLPERAQLRRLVDRVGKRGARADRQGQRSRALL